MSLQDYQFDLDGVLFGAGCPVGVDAEGFDSGSNDIVTQDSPNPLSDGIQFGRDYKRGGAWVWSAFLDGVDPATALQALEDLQTVWESDEYRTVLQDVRTLRYGLAGRTRRIYGRPRRFAAPPGNKIMQGTSAVTMDFLKADPLHYDDTEKVVTLQAQPAAGSGFTWSFTWPLLYAGSTTASQTIAVGGRARTAPVVTFTGPASNPSIVIGEFRIDVIGQIAAGDVLVIDCRPWKMSMTLNGQPVSSSRLRLSRRTNLSTARLKPGNYAAAFLVSDLTGTATATVRWRDAWPSI